ncbi:general transcription factor IIF subunit 1-like isoform X3 [Poeciliopsis prolifica]|uniref:general transcription factor IIF subunit 1-like isoform X3 n=1 Tax=Poeciliopsis prolifica TaxID=188132 RepID=UPI0024138F49|nr:general transcription factor IIF subunit 1-like isoform X3 [Poeciliopsis prolifica]
MKRRSSLRSDSGQEERRLDGERNLRKRQWINYRDDDEDDYEEDDRNQPLTHEDGELWPVTCGVKEGMMDAQKLAKGEKCIEFEGRMFTPPAFEEFGGRGSAKKWKLSIYSGGKPLQHWFDENLLSTEGYRKGKKAYKKGQSFQNNGDNGDAQGSGESGEDATDDSENDDGIPSGCRSWLSWAEEETERNDSDHSDEKQDEEPDEMEKDGDGNDEDDENLCAPQEPDPRFIISTTEKLALQMNSIVLLERISMTRSRCQTAAAEHQRKDDEEGDGDSETNRNEKTKSNEGETPQEPVDSETADVATNTSPQQEPAEQKVHELQGLPADTLTLPGSSARDGHTDVSILDPFESQTKSETSVCDSESTHISDIVENSTSGVLTGSDVDSMDLDQLQRETLKTQLEAAREQKEASRIQKEYYALKLRLLRVRMKAGRFSSPMRAVMQRTLGGTEHFL